MSDDQPTELTKKIEALEAELESAQTELEQAKAGQVRALADLQNFQRRSVSEKAKWASQSQAQLIAKMIPSFLELLRGAEHADETMQKVIEKLFTELEKTGLQKILPEAGDAVDPEKHEVLMAESAELSGVVRCLEPGWSYNDHVIMPAKVSATTND